MSLPDSGPSGHVPILGPLEALEVLRGARRIAIVGASPSPWRASNRVMAYLLGHGYECIPVNPTVAEVLGRPAFPSLEAAVAAVAAAGAGTGGSAFDIVDVFRRPEHAPDVARSAVALGCGTLWLQLGIVSWEAARIAHDGGLRVVMDRCTAIDHRRMASLG